MPKYSDPEGKRLPIKLDATSNGEFEPIPPGPEMASVAEQCAPGPGGDIPLRVYRPATADPARRPS